MDFELASVNAAREAFPNREVTGRFFHFCQSLYRKVVDLGFRVQYQENKNFNLSTRMFAAFAFSPPNILNPGSKCSNYRSQNSNSGFCWIFWVRLSRPPQQEWEQAKTIFHTTMRNLYHRTIEHLPSGGFESMLQINKPDV